MEYQSGHVMTLANSIIGVSVLAMPYCFKQCGIILSIVMLLISSVISRLSCHFLLKSAIMARRKTFEYLAFYIFGSLGKFIIEVGIIGFLIGTCVAFFVVIGDLTPDIVSEITGKHTSSTLRTSILMAVALFCILPLGLLRNVDSLHGVSKATIAFYFTLVLKIIIVAFPHIVSGDWYDDVVLWRPAGIIQCLPIFAMALSCQTQLFEIYQVLNNPTLEKMNNLVRIAVNICTAVYIFVGLFGYIAFAKSSFSGNILMSFKPSIVTNIMKIGFVLSVIFSFPLVIFPSRASLYSLLCREGYSNYDGSSSYIPEGKFKALTMLIVFISLIFGIMIPNIELVLGLVGSTIGVMICVLFPVTSFIYISHKNTNERIVAQFMLFVGIFVMVLGTYENMNHLEKIESPLPDFITEKISANVQNILNVKSQMDGIKIDHIEEPNSNIQGKEKLEHNSKVVNYKVTEGLEVRHEPPQPIEPQDDPDQNEKKNAKIAVEIPKVEDKPIQEVEKMEAQNSEHQIDKAEPKNDNVDLIKPENKSIHKSNDEVDIEAIRKDEKETRLQELEKQEDKQNSKDDHKDLIETIQKQNEVQKEIVKQNQLLIEAIKEQHNNIKKEQIDEVKQEKLKAVEQIQNIALKAIEQISGKENGPSHEILKNKVIEHDGKEEVEQVALKNPAVSSEKNVQVMDINASKKELNTVEENIPEAKNVLTNNQVNETIPKQKISVLSAQRTDLQLNNTNILIKNLTAPLFINLGQTNKNKTETILNLPLPLAMNNTAEIVQKT